MQHLDKLTSEQLLVAVRVGDQASFNEIYFRYRSKVYNYAYRFVRNREDADELTQNAFVKLWDNRGKIDPQGNFNAFLYTILKNDFLEKLRRRSRMSAFVKEGMGGEPSVNSVERYIDFKECNQIIMEAIDLLPPQARLTYQLSRQEGRSHDDISRHMGISRNTVSNHIKKSLNHIRRYVLSSSPDIIVCLLLLGLF